MNNIYWALQQIEYIKKGCDVKKNIIKMFKFILWTNFFMAKPISEL